MWKEEDAKARGRSKGIYARLRRRWLLLVGIGWGAVAGAFDVWNGFQMGRRAVRWAAKFFGII